MNHILRSAPVLLAAPMVAFALMLGVAGWDPALMKPTEHFYIVSATALLSAVIATGLALRVESLRHTRTLFLALGFVALALIFGTHGLSTPGFINEAEGYPYGVVVSAGLSQAVAAAFIAISVLPERFLPGERVRRAAPVLIAGALVALGSYVVVTLARPETWSFLPAERWWDTLLAAATMALLAFAAWRYWRAWRMTRFPGQFAMVAALVLLAEAQVSMYYGEAWHLTWWLYHALLFAAFVTVIVGWAIEAKRSGSFLPFSRTLALRERLDHVDLADPASLDALELAMDGKDAYTREHMGRVAEYAAAIADELGVDERTKLTVRIAGRIHDIGKIVVPDAVLLKPGKLTPEEFEQMKHHAERGEMIARSSKVLADVAAVVRAHHERFAGGGYPDGLAGEQIPLAARIVAVADTFDAITSPRVYRRERPRAEAIAELRRVAGTQLDPACVEAFMRWLEREGRPSGESPARAA